MKKERDDDKTTSIRIEVVDVTPQLNACTTMLYMLPDPNKMSWERGQWLTIADITAIRALRKTIKDNLVPSDGSSTEEWKATIASAVETFSNMPARCVNMKDPNDEEGFNRVVKGIREMLAGASPADVLKKKQEERKKEEQEEEQVESDTKKVKEEN